MSIHLANAVELWPVEKLIPYANNSRTHSDEQVAQIAASIKEFGFTNPVLVDGKQGIIAGHGRLMAAKKLGLANVPVIVLTHLSDAQRRAYIIADNKLALNAGWDLAALSAEIERLEEEGFDLPLLGFSDEELADLMPEVEEHPQGEAEEVPEQLPDPKVAKGELYILGRHRLLCGDATMIDDVQRVMDGQEADLIVTDPPYNVAYEGKTKDSMTIENDSFGSSEEFLKFLMDAFTNYFMVAKPGAGLYVFHADSEGYNFRRAFSESGFMLKQCCVWVKQTLVMGRQDYHWQHEPVLYGWKPGAAHNWYSDRKQTTVWNFNKPARNGEHPTMKPIDLIEYPINNSSKGKDLVVDFFGGSGSTLIASEKNGRRCNTIEFDPKYCQVILDRWEKFTGRSAYRLNDDGTQTPWQEIRE